MVKRRPIDRVLSFFNTCCFVGHIPAAPGTFGSLFAAILIYLFPAVFSSPVFAVLFIVFAVATTTMERYEGEDPGHIVIDEFAGMCVAMAGHKVTLLTVGIGFVLFRIFDILKPFPIGRMERLRGGYGIVGDDVVAGIFANILLLLWTRLL
ncbi:MAG: phosphatidylglycerophosphatase A [Syntrophorhabdaceae bacterium]|nr:phosphatidylglycerophosphatase A [Syntrophorhabdaceae bacterium]